MTVTDSSATTNIAQVTVSSACDDEASASGSANDQGASSCITLTPSPTLMSEETFTIEQAANDALGDGDKHSCEEILWWVSASNTTVTGLLASALSITGILAAWLAVYLYNRLRSKNIDTEGEEQAEESEFKTTSWYKETEMSNRSMI